MTDFEKRQQEIKDILSCCELVIVQIPWDEFINGAPEEIRKEIASDLNTFVDRHELLKPN